MLAQFSQKQINQAIRIERTIDIFKNTKQFNFTNPNKWIYIEPCTKQRACIVFKNTWTRNKNCSYPRS